MIYRIKRFQQKHPFLFILSIGIVMRFIAILFSRGFGMYSDHFMAIEAAQAIIDGVDYQKLLPWTPGNEGPGGHSLFYIGFHYLLFLFFEFFGIYDPQAKMFLLRGLHALLSLMTISVTYRIATLVADRKTAYRVALLLAVLWFMPFVSVRNLAEMVAVPFLLYGTLIILRQELIRKNDEPGFHISSYMVGGFFLGLAFAIHFPSLFYIAGLHLALLLYRNKKGALSAFFGFLSSALLLQGGVDFIFWRVPFAEFIAYMAKLFDESSATDLFRSRQHIIVYLGLLVPPLSLMLVAGFLYEFRRLALLFIPVLTYVVFLAISPAHEFTAMLTIIPLGIALGLAGWDRMAGKSTFWLANKKLQTLLWVIFWVFNIQLLALYTINYPHKARVESMRHLHHYNQLEELWVENTATGTVNRLPLFYARQWPKVVYLNQTNINSIDSENFSEPGFVLFFHEGNLENRLENIREYLPGLVFEGHFKPSFTTRIIHMITKKHDNEHIIIYRNTNIYSEKAVP